MLSNKIKEQISTAHFTIITFRAGPFEMYQKQNAELEIRNIVGIRVMWKWRLEMYQTYDIKLEIRGVPDI